MFFVLGGISKEEQLFLHANIFQLSRKPFAKNSSFEQAAGAKHLANQLLFRLYNHGCKLLVSSELSQTTIRSTWFLHREQTVPVQVGFASIGISDRDILHFVDFPENLGQVVLDVVKENWPKGIQRTKSIGQVLEVKLKGSPWRAHGDDSIKSKVLLRALLNELVSRNWVVYGSTNLRGNADTISFKYDPTIENLDSFKVGFILSLDRDDRMCLHNAPQEAIDAVRVTLKDEYEEGIQREKGKSTAFEFKLTGIPWCGLLSSAVDSRLLLCKIFERLVAIGWRVQLSIDLTEDIEDKSSFTFVRFPANPFKVLCISLNSSNKMRLINFPDDLLDPFLEEVDKCWQFDVSRFEQYYGAPEIKFRGNPWRCDVMGHDNAHGCVLISHIVRMLATMGWFLIISADISSRVVSKSNQSDYPHDVDSLWFMQLWTPANSQDVT